MRCSRRNSCALHRRMAATSHVPHRIYLDTSVLQTIEQSSESVWEGTPLLPNAPARKVETGVEDVAALHRIFRLALRGPFQFIVSEAAIREIRRSGDRHRIGWVKDVRQYSEVCLKEEPPTGLGRTRAALLDDSRFNYLGSDRALLREAVLLECDTFLTMEQKLPKQAAHIFRNLALLVLRPPELWGIVGTAH